MNSKARCIYRIYTHMHNRNMPMSCPWYPSFTNHSFHLCIYPFISFFHSLFLSPKPPCRVQDDYYVNECDWREGRRDGGVRHTARGVLLFLFSLSRSIVPRITPISTLEEYFNIRYSNTHSVIHSSQHLPTLTVHPSFHSSLQPSSQWRAQTTVQKKAFMCT